MDWLTFISSVISSIAWPVAVVTIVGLGRKPLGGFLEKYPRLNLKYKDVEVRLERAVQELVTSATTVVQEGQVAAQETDVVNRRLQLAELSPRGAILESWLDFEDFLRQICLSKGTEITRVGGLRGRVIPLDSTEMARKLLEQGVVTPKAINVIEQLRNVRNQAVHLAEPAITYDMAKNYIEVTAGLKDVIENTTTSPPPT